MTQKNEIAKKQSTDLAAPVSGRGFENVSADQITMPRGKLLQSNSPEVADRDYNFRAGDIIHALLMEKLPEKFIPLTIWESNIMFVPRVDERKAAMKAMLNLSDEDMEQMIICRAADGRTGDRYGNCASCGKHKFVGAEKPLCNATINVLCVPLDGEDLGMPYVLQFSNTSYKHGKKFRDAAFYSSFGGDLFGRVYKVESVEASSGGNKWYEQKVKPAGNVPENLKSQVEAMYTRFAGSAIVVDEEDSNTVEDVKY